MPGNKKRHGALFLHEKCRTVHLERKSRYFPKLDRTKWIQRDAKWANEFQMVHICSDALWTMKSLLSSIVTCFKNITGPCYPGETGERGFRLTLSYSKSEKTHTTRHPPSPSTEEFLQSVPKTQCWHKIPLDNSRPSHTKGFGKTSIPRLHDSAFWLPLAAWRVHATLE